ncbi:hypothetical protein An03g01330 [Aspergillus niger]|uniref:Uncharacterized protein n=2 Tax=Aspergillus niger TaxID=5061 RepID=A2QFZ6_ASPNC|nr:hypothetical protein An03g01330 [Aspergillus niger]CAK38106.1 hypothetical protein An03g01330 [Aspergillus niger]
MNGATRDKQLFDQDTVPRVSRCKRKNLLQEFAVLGVKEGDNARIIRGHACPEMKVTKAAIHTAGCRIFVDFLPTGRSDTVLGRLRKLCLLLRTIGAQKSTRLDRIPFNMMIELQPWLTAIKFSGYSRGEFLAVNDLSMIATASNASQLNSPLTYSLTAVPSPHGDKSILGSTVVQQAVSKAFI